MFRILIREKGGGEPYELVAEGGNQNTFICNNGIAHLLHFADTALFYKLKVCCNCTVRWWLAFLAIKYFFNKGMYVIFKT